jgi:DNA primase
MTAVELKKYIYENKKVEYILSELGCNQIVYHPSKDYYSCCNKDGDNPSAINIYNNEYLGYVNYTRGVSANMNEDIISLVEYANGSDFLTAIKYLHKILGVSYNYKKEPKKKADPLAVFKKYKKRNTVNVKDIKFLSNEELDDFIPIEHISWYKEGIMPWTVKKFGICYSYRFKRIIIPIRYWQNGSLMGYNARSTVPNCDQFGIKKYFLTPGMPKHLNLYGLYENYDSISKSNTVTVFEAEKSVLKRDSLFDDSCVALQGHSLSDEQVRILLGVCKNEIVFALDKDISEKEVWSICDKFYGLRKVSYIYDKWNLLKEKDSPADAQNKVYTFLFKHRVTYDDSKHKEYVRFMNEK